MLSRRPLLTPLVTLAALALSGCSLVGSPNYDDLEPGTFSFRTRPYSSLGGGGWDQYAGAATYHPYTEDGSPYAEAEVSLITEQGDDIRIESDAFLTAEVGDRFAPQAAFGPPFGGPFYTWESGEVEITSVSVEAIGGRFRFRMRDVSIGGPFSRGTLSVEGGFLATRAE